MIKGLMADNRYLLQLTDLPGSSLSVMLSATAHSKLLLKRRFLKIKYEGRDLVSSRQTHISHHIKTPVSCG